MKKILLSIFLVGALVSGAEAAIVTGYVRIKTDHPEVSVYGVALSPNGGQSIFQAHGNVWLIRFDDENPEIDTLVCVINRLNQPDSEIAIENIWHAAGYPLVKHVHISSYTDVVCYSARRHLLGG